MAVDVARQYIDDVETRYDELFPDETPEFKVGGLTLSENDSPPVIKWRFGGIEHEPSIIVDSIGTEVQELLIRIWGAGSNADETDASARTIKNRLLLACRQVAQRTAIPDPITFGAFEWSEEQHNVLGRHLDGSVEVKFAVAGEVFDTVTIAQAQVTQHADYDGDAVNDETIHTTDFFPATP